MSGAALNGKRASRDEIEVILEKLKDLGFNDLCEKHEVCGSYRRGKPDSGDIDIVFIPKNEDDYHKWFSSLLIEKREGYFANNILIDGVQIDLFQASQESYPTMIMTWTGSRGFNIRMRGLSRKAGYAYTRNGMYNVNTNEIVQGIITEKDIFNLVGVHYIPPEKR